MKKYITITAAMVLAAALFTGCAKETPKEQPTSEIVTTTESTTTAPETTTEETESTEETTTQEAPEVEGDDIFSARDLKNTVDLKDAKAISAEDNSEYVINEAGVYVLSGQAENFTVTIDASNEDKVQIVLDGAEVTNEDFPVIYVKSADKCFVTSMGDNKLSVTDYFVSDGDTNTDAVIFSKDDLTLNGTGSLTVVSSAGNGITCKDDMKITGGTYYVNSAKDAIEANDSISINDGVFEINSYKDAIHCENDEQEGSIYIRGGEFTIDAKDDGIQATTLLTVDGGTFNITASEGMEATYVLINDGVININASDDGINAARKSYEYDVVIEINGGDITVVMGPGDTDGLDANGTIIVNGGRVDVSCNSAFDADVAAIHNGGIIIINGVETDEIPTQMMGGRGGGRGGFAPDGGFGPGGGFAPDGGFGPGGF